MSLLWLELEFSAFREIGIRRHNFRKGDLLIIPAGVAHWMYNNGDQDLQVVVMFDTTNNANQLDSIPQRFFVLGNPQGQPLIQQFQGDNILKGFNAESLADAFKVKKDMGRKLKIQNAINCSVSCDYILFTVLSL